MVIAWEDWSDSEAAAKWDATLTAAPGCSLYQSYGWGEYKSRSGWEVRRGTVLVDGTPAAMAQCLVREFRAARIGVIWVPGGSSGTRIGCLKLGEALQRCYRGWHIYVRTNILQEEQPDYVSEMIASGWDPAKAKVGHPRTFLLDLLQDPEARRRKLTGNWRHNLTRAEQRGATIELWDETKSLDLVHAIYRETNRRKGVTETVSLADFDAMRKLLGRGFTMAAAIGSDQRPCAMRAFGKLGDRAYDLIAGVSAAGRKDYSNYLLMWRLLEIARQQGVSVYDLSGADETGVPGVFNFKKGLGGRLVAFMGEWEWASSRWLGSGVNLALRFRHSLT